MAGSCASKAERPELDAARSSLHLTPPIESYRRSGAERVPRVAPPDPDRSDGALLVFYGSRTLSEDSLGRRSS